MIQNTRRPVRAGTTRLLACAVLMGTLCACGTDSAGGASAASDTVTWALDEPAVQVGHGSGAGQELDRVYGGLLRSDGSIVIGNSGTAELRYYDRAGRFAFAAGQRGAGPGEFGGINWVAALAGDSLLAFDLRHQRFSVWDEKGRFVRAFASQAREGSVRPIGVLGDGSVLIAIEGQYDPRRGPGVVRDSMRVLRMGRDGAVLQALGTFAGAEWLLYEHPASFRATQLPFGRSGHLATVENGFVYGSSDSPRLAVHDGTGRLVHTVELKGPPRAVTRGEVDSVLAAIQDAPERSALTRHYRTDGRATAPLFTALRGDRQGNLWVRLSPAPGADSVKWVVLTPRGEQMGSVRMHVGWLPLDVSGNGVLVRESDADGVQRVSLRGIAR